VAPIARSPADWSSSVFKDNLTDPSVFKGVAIMVALTIVSIFIGARAFGRAVA
jgi:hypothetical protein